MRRQVRDALHCREIPLLAIARHALAEIGQALGGGQTKVNYGDVKTTSVNGIDAAYATATLAEPLGRLPPALEGWPVELSDTAGLRATGGEIEAEGGAVLEARVDHVRARALVAVVGACGAAEGQVHALDPEPASAIGMFDDSEFVTTHHKVSPGDTLVLFTSDHGEMLGDHWMLGKAGFFPQAFHVPLLIRHPRGRRGRRVAAFTEHVDLMPTILDALAIEVPRQCDGRTLSDFLTGEQPTDWRAAAHWEHDFRDVPAGTYERLLGLPSDACGIAARFDGRVGYVHFAGLPPLAFIDSPSWLHDRSGDPSCAPEVLAQAQAMLSWRMLAAERRLTGCALTPDGVVGGYDPL